MKRGMLRRQSGRLAGLALRPLSGRAGNRRDGAERGPGRLPRFHGRLEAQAQRRCGAEPETSCGSPRRTRAKPARRSRRRSRPEPEEVVQDGVQLLDARLHDRTRGRDGLLHSQLRERASIGDGGGGLGYGSIGDSVAVEFDTFDNGGSDEDANEVAIIVNGKAGKSKDCGDSELSPCTAVRAGPG